MKQRRRRRTRDDHEGRPDRNPRRDRGPGRRSSQSSGGGSGRPPTATPSSGGFWAWLKRLFSAPERPALPGLTADESRAVEAFSRHLGIHFNDPKLLRLALTHRSYLHVQRATMRESNERLEFLGDSVLGVITSEHLYKMFPGEHEGQLTKTKSLLVSKAILSRRALAMGLGRFVLMSNSEVDSGGRQRLSILADAFEAVLGAIYLDQGIEAARKFVETWLLAEATVIVQDKRHTNYKSLLQEYVQSAFHTHPVYSIRHEHGPDHSKLFTVEVRVGGKPLGAGKGKNKKEAEQSAARDALDKVAAQSGEKSRTMREVDVLPEPDVVERPARRERERSERGPRPERAERAERGDRPERAERGMRPERDDRPDRYERRERRERAERPERSDRIEASAPPAEVERPRMDRLERAPRPDRPERPERPERADRPERAERPERPERVERERAEGGERPERAERPERRDRPERPRGFERRERGPRPEAQPTVPPTPAFADRGPGHEPQQPASRPAEPTQERAYERPAATAGNVDLPSGLVWETPAASPPERANPAMRYGRQPAIKSRGGTGFTAPTTDPSRSKAVSEAPASAPRTRGPEENVPPPSPRRETPRIEAEVREVKGPLPGVDASRYRAAEAPASRFASETPSAWDEDPKEHD